MPTLQQFKAFAKANKSLAIAVCQARAFAQVEQERVMAYIQPIFADYTFKDEQGRPIKDLDHLYLCRDEELCKEFYEVCDRAHREHGFDGPKGNWPNLVADNLRRIAERALIEAGCKFMRIGEIYQTELRDQMLEICMGACLGKD